MNTLWNTNTDAILCKLLAIVCLMFHDLNWREGGTLSRALRSWVLEKTAATCQSFRESNMHPCLPIQDMQPQTPIACRRLSLKRTHCFKPWLSGTPRGQIFYPVRLGVASGLRREAGRSQPFLRPKCGPVGCPSVPSDYTQLMLSSMGGMNVVSCQLPSFPTTGPGVRTEIKGSL